MLCRILLPFACLLVAKAAAVVVDVNLPYKELHLKDGMLFTDVTVRSVNTTAGTVVLLVSKDLVSVRTSMLPDEVNTRLQGLAPAQTKEEQAEERRQEEADRQKAAEKAERRQKMAEDEAQVARAANRGLNVKAAEQAATKADQVLAQVAKFAEERARAYFKYRDDPYSNIGAVVGSDIFLENPEPVPGWTGRYRVEGSAYRQYINNQASGFGRGGKEFEMLIQTSDRKKPEIVEIRIK
jgi:hypothetical protein